MITPTHFQAKLLLIPHHLNIFLGGGQGGGKTFGVLFLAIRFCLQYPGVHILIARRRLKALAQVKIHMHTLLRAAVGVGGYRYDYAITAFLVGTSSITLAHCEGQSALLDLQGRSFAMIIVDEAGHAPVISDIDTIGLSLRAPPSVPTRMILAGNPGGVNHAVLKSRYIDGREEMMPYEHAKTRWVSVYSTVDQNPYISEEYRQRFEILQHTDQGLYRARRLGDWGAITGTFFATVWRPDRMIVDAGEIPTDRFRSLFLSIDWGSAAPCVALLMGKLKEDIRVTGDKVLPSGAWVVYDEHAEVSQFDAAKGTGKTPGEIAPAIRRLCSQSGVLPRGVIDASAEAKGSGRAHESVADLFRLAGIRVQPAKRGPRVPRLERLKELMATGRFYVCSRCQYWLDTVPSLPRDDHHPEDVDTDAVDHALDATVYGIVGPRSGEASSMPFKVREKKERILRI
jgi:hypothetical protein